MATIDFTKNEDNERVDIITWSNLSGAADDEGRDYVSYLRPDKTVQVLDGFSGDTLVIEGSNDGTNYETLTDADGNALSFTGPGLKFVRESPHYLRPRIGGGTGSVTVILVAATQSRG